jgi:hypothetical protein
MVSHSPSLQGGFWEWWFFLLTFTISIISYTKLSTFSFNVLHIPRFHKQHMAHERLRFRGWVRSTQRIALLPIGFGQSLTGQSIQRHGGRYGFQ